MKLQRSETLGDEWLGEMPNPDKGSTLYSRPKNIDFFQIISVILN
jgi:hypothetical protein